MPRTICGTLACSPPQVKSANGGFISDFTGLSGRPRDDEVPVVDPFDAANAAAFEIKPHGSAEHWLLAGYHLCRIVEGDHNRFLAGARISKSDEQAAVGRGGKTFYVEPILRFRRRPFFLARRIGLREHQTGQFRVREHVLAQRLVGLRADRLQLWFGEIRPNPRREEARACRLGLTVRVAAMRTDPVDAIADACRSLDVGLLESVLFLSEPLGIDRH